MFKIFLKDRMEGKSDYWSQLEIMTRPQVKKAGTQLKKQVAVTFLPGLLTREEIIIFKLPTIQDSIKTTIDKLTYCCQVWNNLFSRIGGVMVCILDLECGRSCVRAPVGTNQKLV